MPMPACINQTHELTNTTGHKRSVDALDAQILHNTDGLKKPKLIHTLEYDTVAEPHKSTTPGEIGVIRRLFVKAERKKPMVPRVSVELVAQEGIVGDVGRNHLSSRQVMLQTDRTVAEVTFWLLDTPVTFPPPLPIMSFTEDSQSQVGVEPGKLRENFYIDLSPGAVWPPLSGTILRIGTKAALRHPI